MRSQNRTGRFFGWSLLGLCILFILLGLAFVPQAGIQNDEVLFATPLYGTIPGLCEITLLGKRIPLMQISYLGTVKTWLYAPIFRRWKPSVYSVRVPVLVLGALTLWLFGRLARRCAPDGAALLAAGLLATDTMFLITTVYDWGPVALQHLLLAGGWLLAVRFHQDGRPWSLMVASLLFGLALWDKALFVWLLLGMAAGLAAVYPGLIRRHFTWKRAFLAGLFFVVGAWPMVFYNLTSSGDTVRSNVILTASEVGSKARLLAHSLGGSAALGYIVGEDWAEKPREPGTRLERASAALSSISGGPRKNLFLWALGLSVLLLPWWWRTPARKPVLFLAVFLLVAWGQMALTRGAGGSIHHTVLLWPAPHLLVAICLHQSASRLGPRAVPALLAAAALLCGSNLLLTNQHYAQLVRNGAAGVWSDAILALAPALERTPAKLVFVTDWGILDTVLVLSRGRVPVRVGSDPITKDSPSEEERRLLLYMVSDPDHFFTGHVDGREEFQGVNQRLRRMAAEAGFRKVLLRTIEDRNGRPVFEIFHFTRAQ